MQKTLKRTLSLMLAAVLLCGIMPTANAAETSYKVGDIVEFGSYPQTEVKDAELIDALNDIPKTWVSYGFYSGTGNEADGQMTAKDYMQYCDVTVGAEKYRGVTFSQYRPFYTGYTSCEENSYQDDNGYNTGVTYWFRFEPLHWRVLDPATGLVLCESIIDSQPFTNYVLRYANKNYWSDENTKHYANNYSTSSIRDWLTSQTNTASFYHTAFTARQQDAIWADTLNNNAWLGGLSQYTGAATADKVFLLGYADTLEKDFGFSVDPYGHVIEPDPILRASGTDYAKCLGLHTERNGNSRWYLRTPVGYSYGTCMITQEGKRLSDAVFDTSMGIRPAMHMYLTHGLVENFLVTADAAAGGTVTGGGVFDAGTSATVTAAPDAGFRFIGWFAGDAQISDSAEYTFSVTKDIALFAEFNRISYVVTTQAVTDWASTVSGSGSYYDGDMVTLTAHPSGKEVFDRWVIDGETVSTDNPYTFAADSDVTVQAVFWHAVIGRISVADRTMQAKSQEQLHPVVQANGAAYSLSYSSSNSKIVSVDASGIAAANRAGTATITVTAVDEYGNAVYDTCTVTVRYAWWQWLIRIFLFGFIWY